ncbi:MAG: NDP-sugar synthase [Muribaculaceae bacterium]|nr:NDP-sugar synthase [Muribaculaceae bacterium]
MLDFGIIAAGDGKRIKEEGSLLPKPLVEIEGRPMIFRLIDLMVENGAKTVNVVVNENMTQVIEALEKYNSESSCRINFSPIKTPSSLYSFYRLVNLMKPTGKFVVSTVDAVCKTDEFKKFIECFRELPHGIDGLMGVTTYVNDEKALYIETEGRHRIVSFLDKPFEGVKYVSAGIYGLQTSAFPVLQECVREFQNIDNSNSNLLNGNILHPYKPGYPRMRDFQRKLLEKGLNLDAFPMGRVVDVDHLEDIKDANSLLN